MNIEASALLQALKVGNVTDVEFSEMIIPDHKGTGETKVGCRPIKVRGITIPNPNLVAYVRAQDSNGMYWYVVDSSIVDAVGIPQVHIVTSEEQAKEEVFLGLRNHEQSAMSGLTKRISPK